MDGRVARRLVERFEAIAAHDPRVKRRRLHRPIDVVVTPVCGVLGGCESFTDVERYGKRKRAFFRQFLELPHGIPSHDNFSRVFARLDTAADAGGMATHDTEQAGRLHVRQGLVVEVGGVSLGVDEPVVQPGPEDVRNPGGLVVDPEMPHAHDDGLKRRPASEAAVGDLGGRRRGLASGLGLRLGRSPGDRGGRG